ncbi:Uncharacterised protein [Mycobacterium tuberculosis]|nr:Uncharacterised protein [Mycobacterium tuberculosis]
MSTPTVPIDQLVSSNALGGNAINACCSTASNIRRGWAPSKARKYRSPATSVLQVTAACCIWASESNSRPFQNESRT